MCRTPSEIPGAGGPTLLRRPLSPGISETNWFLRGPECHSAPRRPYGASEIADASCDALTKKVNNHAFFYFL